MKNRLKPSTAKPASLIPGVTAVFGLRIPHPLEGLSISTGYFATAIVWTARQIGKPYLSTSPTTNPTKPKTGTTPWDSSGCVIIIFFTSGLIDSVKQQKLCSFVFICLLSSTMVLLFVVVNNGPLCAFDHGPR
jgi:hypothetical protein